MVTKAFFDENGMKSADKVTASSNHTAQQYPAQTQTQPQSSQHTQQATGQNTQVAGSSPAPYYPNYYGQSPHQAAPHQAPHQAPHHHVPSSRNPPQPYYPGYTNGAYINNTNSEGYSYTQNPNPIQHKAQNHGMAPPKAHYKSPTTSQGSPTPAKATNVSADKSAVSKKAPKDDSSTIILTTIKENDVTHGKGSSFNHNGNEKYRNCLKKYYKNYVIADAHGKTSIAIQIHREITDQVPGGRFLVYNHKQAGWELMPIKEATEYIQHVLNDCEIREKKRLAERRTVVEGTKPAKKQKTANIYDHPAAAVITIDDSLPEEPEERIAIEDNNEKETIAAMNGKSCESQESSKKNEEKFPSRHCDTCLGTGLLPVPEVLAPFTKSWPTAKVNFPMTAQFPQQLENPLIPPLATAAPTAADSTEVGTTGNNQGTNEDAATSSNHPNSVFAANLRLIEEKWGITNGSNLTYPERVQQIEEKTQNQRRSIATETAFLQNDHVLQMLEEAERKWGIKAPEGFNLGERVELVEKTAFNFISRMQVWL